MEMRSLWEVFFSPVAQVKFVHTVAGLCHRRDVRAGRLRLAHAQSRDLPFMRRSFAVAVASGWPPPGGDRARRRTAATVGDVQKVKLAAIEAEWKTEPAPAAFTLFGLPSQDEQATTARCRCLGCSG